MDSNTKAHFKKKFFEFKKKHNPVFKGVVTDFVGSIEDISSESYAEGWDDCMKYLSKLPWNEAMNAIVDYSKTNN